MPKPVIHVPHPCRVDWAALQFSATGRYCAACEKNVIDFADKTDAEILAVLAGAGSSALCGRFAARQLNRPLELPKTQLHWRAGLAAALTLWGIKDSAGAPAPALITVEQVGKDSEEEFLQPNLVTTGADTIVIKGVVLDSATHQGMPGATVLLKGTQYGMAADINGRFSLAIAADQWHGKQVAIRFMAVGYFNEEIVVTETSATVELGEIILRVDPVAMQEASNIIVGGVCVTQPWPWHPRRFYHWLTQPFRR